MRFIAVLAAILSLAAGTAQAASPGDVVINEVAWAGSVASAADEWIELYNNTGQPVDLDGWIIVDDEGLAGEATYTISAADCAGGDCTIPADGFFMIERDDTAVDDLAADLLVAALDLDDAGDSLTLKDDLDAVIDFVDCAEETSGWYAGTAAPLSMERVDPLEAGDLASNWADNDPAAAQNGTDSGGNAVNGTPGQPNSVPAVCVDNDADGHCADVDCNDDDILVYPGADELCDQVDNDCDDQTDEDFPDLGEACDSTDDPDLCENGVFVCNALQDGTVCFGDVPTPELCNGVDDDCDSEADEDWPELGTSCDGPDEDTCENGEYVCSADMAGVTCNESGTSGLEICNGYDDDCDGQTDEDLGTYTCGFGVCMVTVDTCVDGQPQECIPSSADEERETTCDDGLDNDCDALVDDDDVDCRGGGGGDSCSCGSATDAGFALLAMFLMMLGLGVRRTR